MRRPFSLALRLTLQFGITTAIVFMMFGIMVVQSTESHFKHEDSDELEVIAHAVQEVIISADMTLRSDSLNQRFDDILVGHHNASLYITDRSGQVVFASLNLDLSRVAQAPNNSRDDVTVSSWTDDDHTYRVLTQSMSKDVDAALAPLVVTVAVPIDHHQRFLAGFKRNLWLMIAGSIALMSLMGWVAVRQGHAPLHDIVGKIHRISANELSTRLSPDTVPAELTELAVSFNDMLARVDKAFHRLSDFNADMAHELRTPIASLMTQTEVALTRARTVDEYREILYSNMEEYERMAQMVGDMLYLAQADNPQQRRNVVELEMAREVAALFEYYEGWADERGVKLTLEGQSTVSGDRLMLQRALGNLLSNAIRHTPSGGTVHVALNATDQGEVVIEISNPGTAIPPEHIPRLFDRFYRVDASRQKSDQGVGLGLAIVASIVQAHDGKIDVVSTDDHTRFILTLPCR